MTYSWSNPQNGFRVKISSIWLSSSIGFRFSDSTFCVRSEDGIPSDEKEDLNRFLQIEGFMLVPIFVFAIPLSRFSSDY